jgi:hypothetical protein
MAPVVLLKQVEQESQTPATDSYIEVGRNLHGFDTGYANNIFPRRHKLILDARLHGHDSEMVVRDEVGVTVISRRRKSSIFVGHSAHTSLRPAE